MAQNTCDDCGASITNPRAKRCRSCYDKSRPRSICTIEGCGLVVTGHGFCELHRQRFKAGRPLDLPRFAKTGRPLDGYAGDWFPNGHGYLVRNEYGPYTSGKRETVRVVLQHRHVMEEKLGRALLPGESVHHINGVRDDNRPENLELWSKSQPAGQRVADKIEWAVELLKLYAPERLV